MRDQDKTKAQLIAEVVELRAAHEATQKRQQGLREIRSRVWAMRDPADMDDMLLAIVRELEELAIPVQDFGVNVVDPDDPTRTIFHMLSSEGRLTAGVEAGSELVYQIWREGKIACRQFGEGKDIYGEGDRIEALFGHPVRSVIDIPFSHGTLAANSAEEDAFTEQGIADLQAVADVLSEGFQRMEELRVLELRNREFGERDSLLAAFHRIGVLAQKTLEVREMLSELCRQVVESGMFRSVTASLVDREQGCIEEVCGLAATNGGYQWAEDSLHQRDLAGPDIQARVVRSGQLEVVEEWDEEMYTPSDDRPPASYEGKVAYFIPVKRGEDVVAVLATGSPKDERANTLRRIDGMQPLLDQVAIALEHARLYEVAQREIAERKQAEVALQVSERNYREIFRATNDAIMVHDTATGQILDVNDKLCELLGYPHQEAIQLTAGDLSHGEPPYTENEATQWIRKAADEGPQLFEWLARKSNGDLVWLEVSLKRAVIAGRDVVLAVDRDITDRKLAEEAVSTSLRSYSEILNASNEAIFVHDMETSAILDVNETMCTMFGYTQPEAITFTVGDLSQGDPPHDMEHAQEWVRRAVEEGPQRFEWLARRKSGDLFWAETNLKHAIIGGEDRILAFVRDIAERKQAEKATALSLAVQRVRNEIVQMDREEDWSRVLASLYRELGGLMEFYQCGFTLIDREAETHRTYSVASDGPLELGTYDSLPASLRRVIDTQSPWCRRNRAEMDAAEDLPLPEVNSTLDVPFREGTLAVSSRAEDAFDEADIGVLTQFSHALSEGRRRLEDISERNRAEQSLMQSSRLIALGQMAAGMAHELNQPLTVISALAGGMQVRLEEGIEMTPQRLQRWSEDVMEGVDRMSSIIEHLRTFSRDRTEEPHEQVAINEVVRGTLTMTLTQLKSRGIEVDVDLDGDLAPTMGDRYRLEQVLINLVHNARDAVEERQEQTPSSESGDWRMRVDIRTRQEQGQVVMEVEDNGVGMDEESRLQALEPFYTTKGPDRGTGLGLSISHAIVKDHGGDIESESREGEGTVFRVRLPLPQ